MRVLDKRRVKKITKILLGKFSKGDRVKVVRMPPSRSVMWREEWVGFEGTYIRPAYGDSGRISQVYFPYPNILCHKENGWLVDDAKLEHL